MTEPGFYPDPDGTADQYRFWDGEQWTDRFGTYVGIVRPDDDERGTGRSGPDIPGPYLWIFSILLWLGLVALAFAGIVALR